MASSAKGKQPKEDSSDSETEVEIKFKKIIVPVLLTNGKNSKRIEALVDTGCNSFIKISKSVVIELGLIPLEKNSVGNTELATGEKVEIKFYKDITLSLLSHENVDQELCVRSINVNPYAHEQLGSDNSNFLLGLQSLHDIGVLIDCADYKLKIKTLEKLVIPNKRKRLND